MAFLFLDTTATTHPPELSWFNHGWAVVLFDDWRKRGLTGPFLNKASHGQTVAEPLGLFFFLIRPQQRSDLS